MLTGRLASGPASIGQPTPPQRPSRGARLWYAYIAVRQDLLTGTIAHPAVAETRTSQTITTFDNTAQGWERSRYAFLAG